MSSSPAKPLPPLLRVFSYLRRYPALAAGQLACAVAGTVMILVFPNVTKKMIDEIIPAGNHPQFWLWIGIAAAAFFARDFCNSLRILLNNTFEQKVIYDLRSELYARLQTLPARWFDEQPTGDVMTRVAEDVPSTERVLIDGIEIGLVSILQVLIVAVYLFIQTPLLGAAALAPVPILVVAAIFYTRHNSERHRRVRRATSAMNSLLHDNIGGVRQIKAYNREQAEHERFDQSSDQVRSASLQVMRAWALYNPSMSFITSLGYCLVLAVGGWQLLAGGGALTIGQLSGALLLIWALYDPINRINQLNQLFLSGQAAAERVFAILDTAPEPRSRRGERLPQPVRGHIRFDAVDFRYRANGPATLEGVTLEARPGEMIALVGSTGAGKSTIINLLTGFYEYQGGSLTIDGHEVSHLAKPALREHIGYVTQESYLFNGTVRSNLEFAVSDDHNASRQLEDGELWRALEAANAKAFVERLPEGLDTHIGERGVKLSVGEKQRLSIARVLLKNPPILLLDEATASVDTETERQIQEALERVMAQRTSIVIAHRLSTVRHAKRIYVLERGKVIEQGSHDELLAHGGRYAHLAALNFLAD